MKDIFLKDKKFRIINFKDISVEYCCGTHVNNTRNIGLFIIINNYNVSSNIKRIEAMSYLNALNYINKQYFIFQKISNILSVNKELIIDRILSFLNKNKKRYKELNELKLLYINDIISSMNININNINILNNFNFLVKKINFLNFINNKNILFSILNKLRLRYKLSVILFIMFINKYKINYIFCIDKYIINKIDFTFLDKELDFISKNKNIILENKMFLVYYLIKKNFKVINLNFIKNLVKFIKKRILFFKV